MQNPTFYVGVVVVGSLQGQGRDEPDPELGVGLQEAIEEQRLLIGSWAWGPLCAVGRLQSKSRFARQQSQKSHSRRQPLHRAVTRQ